MGLTLFEPSVLAYKDELSESVGLGFIIRIILVDSQSLPPTSAKGRSNNDSGLIIGTRLPVANIPILYTYSMSIIELSYVQYRTLKRH